MFVILFSVWYRAYETSLLVDQEISSEIPYNGMKTSENNFVNLFIVRVANLTWPLE